MSKLKEIEGLERTEQRLILHCVFILLPLFALGFITACLVAIFLEVRLNIIWITLLCMLPVTVATVFVTRKSSKTTKRFAKLRKEWLEEVGLPKNTNFTFGLFPIPEGKSRTFTHQEGNEVIVYRLTKRNGEFVLSKGVAALIEVKPKEAGRPLVEETENDELWKLVGSNSPTDED